MKRSALLIALAALSVVPATGHAAEKRTERKIDFAYTGFCDAGIDGLHGGPTSCPTAAQWSDVIAKGESYIKFSAGDSKIGLRYFDTADFSGTVQSFCGGTDKALKVKSGQEMAIKVSVDPTCGAIPTTGTITIVISNQA